MTQSAKDYDHRVWTHVWRWRDLATVFFGIVAVRQTGSQNGCLNTRWTHMLINTFWKNTKRERCWSSCKQRRPASFSKIWELFPHLAGKCTLLLRLRPRLSSIHQPRRWKHSSSPSKSMLLMCPGAATHHSSFLYTVYCILYSLYSYLNYHSIIEEWCDVCGDQMYRKKLSTLESACRMG